MEKVLIKEMHRDFKMPKLGVVGSACFDCYAVSRKIHGDGRIEYGLGFALEFSDKYALNLKARSSVHKTGMILSNGVGCGEASYRGEYKAMFYNIIKELPIYEVGDRVCQIELYEHFPIQFNKVLELGDTVRGKGGFGSAGQR
jgi:dUTP pyrophosphatase